VETAPHLQYSHNLAPSGICLFGHVKECLAGLSLESADALPEAVKGDLEGIEKGILQAVFLARMDRLRKCIATSGGYPDQTKTKIVEESSFIRTVLRSSPACGTLCISAGSQSLLLAIP
jgi:hypothetical protein